jgi:hypothetical protein
MPALPDLTVSTIITFQTNQPKQPIELINSRSFQSRMSALFFILKLLSQFRMAGIFDAADFIIAECFGVEISALLCSSQLLSQDGFVQNGASSV